MVSDIVCTLGMKQKFILLFCMKFKLSSCILTSMVALYILNDCWRYWNKKVTHLTSNFWFDFITCLYSHQNCHIPSRYLFCFTEIMEICFSTVIEKGLVSDLSLNHLCLFTTARNLDIVYVCSLLFTKHDLVA